MIELRIHGRGGQGAVVASKTLAQAAFLAGRYVQSYPDYGVERRGAPVVAFARIAEPGDDLFVRQDIREPHHLLILDATLLDTVNPLAGLRHGGWVVVNTPDPPQALGIVPRFRVATVNATRDRASSRTRDCGATRGKHREFSEPLSAPQESWNSRISLKQSNMKCRSKNKRTALQLPRHSSR